MGMPKIFDNWKVVLLSFLGATTFWFFSALGKDYNYRIKYPIDFLFDKDSLVAVKPLPKYVDVDVSGGGWDLFRESFWFGSNPIIIELENPAAIRYLTRPTLLPILSEQLNEYRINFLFTDTIFIDINRRTSKVVNLKLDSSMVQMEDDYRMISPITISPDTATIFGPTSFIDTLQSEYLVTLDEDDLDRSFDGLASLNLPDAYGIYASPPAINVKFNVDKFETLEIETVVEMQNFPEDSSAYVADPSVTIRFVVQRSLKEDFLSEDFKIVTDYTLVNPTDSMAPTILVFYPENALELEVSPDSLAITYEE